MCVDFLIIQCRFDNVLEVAVWFCMVIPPTANAMGVLDNSSASTPRSAGPGRGRVARGLPLVPPT